ncbi:glycosyltransferase family 4 protein [Candidatus Woesearchaeota archaeon]|nr:glycosyltransferase family 4 protein [Candidatus Woesearchaeota archaeon]
MKKLLIPTDSFLPKLDGATSFLKEILPRLEKEFDITVVCPDYGAIPQKFNIKLVRFKPYDFFLGDIQPAMPNLSVLRKEIKNTDIVWLQGFGLIGFFSLFLAKRFRKPKILITHIIEWDVFPKGYGSKLLSVPINITTKFVMKILYNKCNLIMVPSLELSELLTLLGINAKKRIIKLGIDSKKFIPPKSKADAKSGLQIPENNFVVGYIGRLALEKDLKSLFRAFQRLHSKYENVTLMIVGEGREDIKKIFRHRKNVMLVSAQENVVPYYQALDVHVLPSLTETTNLSTLEAMSCEVAVIATPVGYVKEYIKNKKNGLIFPKKNSYSLFKRLEYLMHKPKFRQGLGKNARKTVLEKFSWEETVIKIKEILSKF